MKITTVVAFILTVVGALVWLIVGIADINIVALIFGEGPSAVVSRIIYILVGLSGIWLIFYELIFKPAKKD